MPTHKKQKMKADCQSELEHKHLVGSKYKKK